MKHLLQISLILLLSLSANAQDNIFWSADFWKQNPDIATIEAKIKEGNSPTALNSRGFDAVSYAILNKVSNASIKYLLELPGNEVNKLTHDKRTYIFWAANRGNVALLDYLFKKGANPKVFDNRLYSPIMFAARAGLENTAVYDILIKNGVDPAYANPKGINALLVLAGTAKDWSILDYFIKKGLPIDHTDKTGKNAVDYAAVTGNKKIMTELIRKGVAYKDINKDNTNLFHQAASSSRAGDNKLEFFKYLNGLELDPLQKDQENKNILHYLAKNNSHPENLDYFFSRKVDIDAVDNHGNTVLLYAASQNNLPVVNFVLDHSQKINHTNKAGESALSLAVQNNQAEIVAILLENGAHTNIVSQDQRTLLGYLISGYSARSKEDFYKKWELLKAKNLDFKAKQGKGNTLLHLAAEKEDLNLIDALLQEGVDINAQNDEGVTLLHKISLTAKDSKMLKELVKRGADPSIKTLFEETAYDMARENELLKNENIQFLKS